MAKKRFSGRIEESSATYKPRKKQQMLDLLKNRAKKLAPPKKTKPMTLIEKGDQIGLLAIKHEKKYNGARTFLGFLVMRRNRGIKAIKELSIPHEKKMEAIVRGLIQAGTPITAEVFDINQWLNAIGRPDLHLKLGEVIELFLS